MTEHDDMPLVDVDVEEPAPRTLLVRVRGELDFVASSALEHVLERRLADRAPARLVLDLEGVTLLATAALDLLVRLRRRSRVRGTHLVLVGSARPAVNRPLRVTGLLPLFDTRPSVAAALRGAVPPSGPPRPVAAAGPAGGT